MIKDTPTTVALRLIAQAGHALRGSRLTKDEITRLRKAAEELGILAQAMADTRREWGSGRGRGQ